MVDGNCQHTQINISTTYRCKNRNKHSSRCSRKVARAKRLIQTNLCGYSEGERIWVKTGTIVHHSKQNFYAPQQFNTRRTGVLLNCIQKLFLPHRKHSPYPLQRQLVNSVYRNKWDIRETYEKYIHCVENAHFLNITAGGTYSCHWTSKCKWKCFNKMHTYLYYCSILWEIISKEFYVDGCRHKNHFEVRALIQQAFNNTKEKVTKQVAFMYLI